MKKSITLALLFLPFLLSAQKTTIRGKVYDRQTKEALIAATVRVGNEGLGTITNADGDFLIDLPQGKHKFVFSYVGYKTDTVFADTKKDTVLICYLNPGDITLPEITVNANENPAYAIIRAAIKNKKENRKGLLSFEYDAYIKRSMKSDGKLASVEESFVKGFQETGKPLKEFVQSFKKTENIKGTMRAPTSMSFIDFTENRLDLQPSKIPLPLADDAFEYYDYKLLTITETGNESVYQIQVIPLSRLSGVLEGTLSINGSDFTLIGVNLKNSDGFTIPFIEELNLHFKQVFSNYSGYWIPQFTEFDFAGTPNIGGLLSLDKLEMNQTYSLTRCTANSSIPETVRNAKKSVYGGYTKDTSAVAVNVKRTKRTKRKPDPARIAFKPSEKPDTLSAQKIEEMRPIPLSIEETVAYKNLDSSQTMDKLIKVKGPMSVFANPKVNGNSLNKTEDSWMGKATDAMFEYGSFRNNRVEGIYLGMSADYDSMNYDYFGNFEAGYAIGMDQFEGKIGFGYNLGEDHLDRIDANIFRKAESWNPYTIHPLLVNTIFYSLEGVDNFNYTINSGWNVGVHKYFTDSLYFKLYYVSETKQDAPLSNSFSIFNRKLSPRINPAISEGNDRKINFIFGWGIDPFSFQDKFAGDPNYQNGIFISADFSHPSLGSSYDYRKIFISGQYRVTTMYKEQFLAPYLIAKVDVGVSSGKHETFNLFSPDASMNYYAPFGTMRALNAYQLTGNKMVSLQMEHNWRAIPFSAVYLNFVRDLGWDLITGFNMTKVWNETPYFTGQNLDKPYWETNISLSRLFAFLRFDAVYTSNSQWYFRFGMASIL